MPHRNQLEAAARPRILLVEDDPAVRRSLQLMLHGKGYDVRSYASGVALLADPTVTDAACFVTDYRLPDLDGFELLRAMREGGWSGPSVLVTAFNSELLSERAEAAGFSAVVEKPLHERSLAEILNRVVT